MTDWNKLEEEVNNTIKNGCPIDFDTKKIEECKYQQKYAENQLTKQGIWLSIIVFTFAIGVSYVLATYKDPDAKILNWAGLIVVVSSLIGGILWIHMNNRNNIIILKAEQRILSETGAEPSQQQEITDILPHAQENKPNNGGNNIDQIEFIKAQLDLLKLIMAGYLGGMLVLSNSILQNTKTVWEENRLNVDIIIQLFVLFVLFLLIIKLMTDYKTCSKKLNEK